MKRFFELSCPLRKGILSFFFSLLACGFLTAPDCFSAEEASDSSKPAPAETPPIASDNGPRGTPVDTLYTAQTAKVEAVADSLEFDKETGKLIARGNAVISYQDTKLLADYAEVETNSKKAYAKGHVLIFKGDQPRMQGEEAYYDFGNHTGSFPNGRAISSPTAPSATDRRKKDPTSDDQRNREGSGTWYVRGAEIHQVRDGVAKVKQGHVTTCSYEKPHYEIRCKRATVYTNVKLVMQSATFYVLGKPVFWLPYVSFPLNWPSLPFQVSAGHTSEFGSYILLSKGITLNQYLWGRAHADWRAKKGFGGGWDQFYEFGKYAQGNVKLYWTQDKEAPSMGYRDSVTGDSNPYAERENRDRGRITWRHRSDINDGTYVLLRYNRLADEYFLKDFFEKEYRDAIEQHSFVTVAHNTERYGIMVHNEKKMNSFEGLVERLPEVRLDWKNQPFIKDVVFNESRVQFDNIAKRYKYSDESQEAIRTDAYSRWYMPLKWNEIKLTPHAGYRGTEYSRQLNTSDSVYRNIVEYGADLRTQVYRTYNVNFDKMGIEINQLRHLVEPIVRFEGTYSSVAKDRLTRFDTTDALDDAQNIIFGLENRLQTKRMVQGQLKRVDIVSLNTYAQYEGTPADPTIRGSQFTLTGGELTLRPYEWLQYQARVEYDFANHYLKLGNQDILIRTGRWRFLFGQRFTHYQYDWYEDRWIDGSQQFVFDTRFQFNRLWEFGGYIRWDSEQGALQEWQISAARDLHDFILEFGFNARNSWVDSNNNQLYFNFRMKGFPTYEVRSGSKASFSEPRIGETVAGANEHAGGLLNPGDNQLISLKS